MENSQILGKYVPRNTFIHKTDPRIKLFLAILLMVAVFLPYGTYWSTFILNGLLLILIITLLMLAKIKPLQVLSSLKMLWMTLLFLLIVNIFIPNSQYTYVILEAGDFRIYLESILQSVKILLRIMMMVMITLLLTGTTKSTDLSYAFEWYLSPLKLFKVPVQIFAMIISLTLRFIPTLLEEAYRIKKAQESRGVDFEHGKISSRFKAVFSLLVPLLVVSFTKSAELAEALEVRGYVPTQKRTKYQVLHFSYRDVIALLSICAVCAGYYYLAYYQYDLLKCIFQVCNALTVLGA